MKKTSSALAVDIELSGSDDDEQRFAIVGEAITAVFLRRTDVDTAQ